MKIRTFDAGRRPLEGEMAWKFGKLLSCSDDRIKKLLERGSGRE